MLISRSISAAFAILFGLLSAGCTTISIPPTVHPPALPAQARADSCVAIAGVADQAKKVMQKAGELDVTGTTRDGQAALAFRVLLIDDTTSVHLSNDAERALTALASGAQSIQLEPDDTGQCLDRWDANVSATRDYLIRRGIAAGRINSASEPERQFGSATTAGSETAPGCSILILVVRAGPDSSDNTRPTVAGSGGAHAAGT